MEKLYPPLIQIILVCLFACNQHSKPIPINTSLNYKKGKLFFNVKNDSAFFYFNNVINSSNDSLQIAMAYTFMAIIQSDAGDYFGSQENLLSSIKRLDERNERNYESLFSNYNELGNNNLNLRNYDAAIDNYNKALNFAKDSTYKKIALNNTAVSYQKMHEYNKSLSIYQAIAKENLEDKKEIARVLSNMAYTKWLQDSNYNATPDLWGALQIREKEKDNWGLNASYAHLSDYYTHSQPDSALIYAEKMYTVAQQLNSPDDELEALQKLITLGASKDVKKYFTRYQSLSDSLQTARNNAKNQFALIRYEATKNKADNLALQKDNAEKKIQIILQWVAIAGVFVMAMVAFTWYRKRKQQMLHEQQLKTSRKVHDIVANGIYHILSDVEHANLIEKEPLLDKLERVYEQSRNISHEITASASPGFHESIAKLIKSFSSPATSVSLSGNTKAIWDRITPATQKELERVLLELMVNMKKHSAAQNVAVKFEHLDHQIRIQYTDDGVGLPTGFQYGNGLTNTENRIAGIGGTITFGKSTVQGLKVLLFIPTIPSK